MWPFNRCEIPAPVTGNREVDYIDTAGLFPLALKYAPRTRALSSVAGVTVHVTDVTGGFGVSSKAVARFAAPGGIDADLRAALADIAPADRPRAAALLERYSRTPYHTIGSRAFNGIAVRNQPAKLRTSHGNGGNRGMGWALDAGYAEELAPALIDAGIQSLEACIVEASNAAGRPIPIWAHRAFSRMRRNDPGAIVWRAIVLPVAESLRFRCWIDHETAENGGLPPDPKWG